MNQSRTQVPECYRTDLAYIHAAGHGGIATDAAQRLIAELANAGIRDGTVVDLGCGAGILAGLLVNAGYRVLGIDLSEAMVSRARAAVPAAEFRVGSFVSIELPACVAVVAVGEVLNFLFDAANDDDVRLRLFERIHQALVPGGLLICDIADLDRKPPYRTFAEGLDWAVMVQTELDVATGLLTRTITSFRQLDTLFRRDVEIHRLALLDRVRFLLLLQAAGFEAQIVTRYNTLQLPTGVTPFICRKPGRTVP